MKIAKDHVVTIDYTLTDDKKTVLDTSQGQEPLSYLHGHRNIIPGLEKALAGKQKGDSITVSVAPDEGYGQRQPQLIHQVPRTEFAGLGELSVGMQFQVDTPMGPQIFSVTQIAPDTVTLDGNHPLAGQNLNFQVEIVDVRAATTEEIAHGHVHSDGDHHHS